MRELILSEIRRLAEASGGKAPGVGAFTKATGIGQSQWYGVIWARWGDALREAGFTGNTLQARLDSADVLRSVVEAFREQGAILSKPEMMMRRRRDRTFPSVVTVTRHLGSRAEMIEAIRDYCRENESFSNLLPLIPPAAEGHAPSLTPVASKPTEGWVYLIRSSDHFKIGRSDQIERRVKEIRIALPEAATLVHAIRTDDPPGIEAYWHRRFADRRANGEWFKLTPPDVAAFLRRKFQ